MVPCPPAHVHIPPPSAVPPAVSLWPLPAGGPTCCFLTVPSVLSSPTRSWPGSFSGWLISLAFWQSSALARLHWDVPSTHGRCPGSCPLHFFAPAAALTVSPDVRISCCLEDPATCFGLELPSQLFAPSAQKPWICSQLGFSPYCLTSRLWLTPKFKTMWHLMFCENKIKCRTFRVLWQ